MKTLRKLPIYIAAALVAAIYVVPLILILLNSIKNEAESSLMNLSWPTEPQFDNYVTVLLGGEIFRAFMNGLFLATMVTLMTVVLCSLSAFIIQRNSSRLSGAAYKYLLAGMIAPFSYIPAIKLLNMLNLNSSYAGIIFIDLSMQIPIAILLFVGFVKGIPRELDEAAIMDGCKPLQLYYRIIFPLLAPVVATNIVLTFTAIWNDFTNILFFVPDSSMWTMPMQVYNFQGFHTYNYGLVSAFIIISLIPVMIVYMFAQKYIVSGMTTGAVKG